MRFLALIGALAILFGIGSAVFFFGGYYSVAGTAEDPAAVTWALTKGRTASVSRYATDSPPAALGEAAIVEAGGQPPTTLRFAERPPPARGSVAEIFGRVASRPTRPEESRRRPLPIAAVLDHQERHQDDGHAELCPGRRNRHRDLVDRGFRQEAADRFRLRLQALDGVGRIEEIGRAQPCCPDRPASPASRTTPPAMAAS